MRLTRFDIGLSIFVLILTISDLLYGISSTLLGLDVVLMLGILALFLIWAAILTYNISLLAIDYAFDEEDPLQKKFRTRKLYRTTILVGTVIILFLLTLFLVTIYTRMLGFVVSINLLTLRGAFLFLEPEENPYYIMKPQYGR